MGACHPLVITRFLLFQMAIRRCCVTWRLALPCGQQPVLSCASASSSPTDPPGPWLSYRCATRQPGSGITATSAISLAISGGRNREGFPRGRIWEGWRGPEPGGVCPRDPDPRMLEKRPNLDVSLSINMNDPRPCRLFSQEIDATSYRPAARTAARGSRCMRRAGVAIRKGTSMN